MKLETLIIESCDLFLDTSSKGNSCRRCVGLETSLPYHNTAMKLSLVTIVLLGLGAEALVTPRFAPRAAVTASRSVS